MEIKQISIDELKEYENNPRRNENAVEVVANSIREFGFKVPMVVTNEGVIIAGHTRFAAAKSLGMTEVPCIVASDLSEDQIRAFRLADNKTGEIAIWNNEKLQEELNELYGIIDMEEFGFPIQIEDIDVVQKGEIPFSDEFNYANNYVVLQFDTEDEWEKAIEVLGLQKVSTTEENVKTRRVGIGRVLKGEDVVRRLAR